MLHGREIGRSATCRSGCAREVVGVLGQSKLFLRPIPGLMHLLALLGLPRAAADDPDVVARRGDRDWTIPWLAEQGWFAFIVDAFAVGVLVGVAIAFVIRLGQRPVRFVGSHLQVAYNILLFEAAITLTLFVWHGSRIALGLNEYPAAWAPISAAVGSLLPSSAATEVLERGVVWVHAVLILAFLALHPLHEAPPHARGRVQRLFRPDARPRSPRAAPVR